MTDKSKRGAPAATNGPSKAATDSKTFSARLLKVASEFASLSKETDGLKEYGKLFDCQTALQEELQGKTEEIQTLKQERDSTRKQAAEEAARLRGEIAEMRKYREQLTEEYHAGFKVWDADKDRHAVDSAEVSRLSEKLEACRVAAGAADHDRQSQFTSALSFGITMGWTANSCFDVCQVRASGVSPNKAHAPGRCFQTQGPPEAMRCKWLHTCI
ncbi:hypothetical protein F5883DRAFT_20685 [Diaporthe sp. PMI_573]|nr:hypothetical protein F5883DRAFT_20685 [Diaporthaceae sp. PMI_573]